MIEDHLKILLIDDDEDDYISIRETLSEAPDSKYRLTWRATYEEGLEIMLKGSFDAVLLDYRLGQWTGLDFIREVQRREVHCPIILLTGQGDFNLDIQAMQMGAADYLVKSQITPLLLDRAIRYSIKHALDMQDLSEQKENFKTLFNSTFEGIIVIRKGHVVDANAAALDMFQSNLEKIVETPILNLIRSDFHSELTRQFETGRDLQLEVVGLKKDGSEMFLNLSSRTINLKGHWVSLLAVRDLTQRKQMEAQILQQDRLASLGLLASSLAHEIGTPLGVIRGRAELLSSNPDEKVKSTVQLIVSQIDRITQLVNSLLHIARGQQSEATTDVELKRVWSDVHNLLSHELNRKGIDLSVEIPTSLTVRAEAGPLGQVLLNLMVNSIHALEGRPEFRKIQLKAQQVNGGVQIQLLDNGCGISEKNLKRLFQPFFTTKDIGVGTGLGLATSYKIIQSWGGSIRAESRENEGTQFTLALKSSDPEPHA